MTTRNAPLPQVLRSPLAWIIVLALGAVLVFGPGRTTEAESKGKVDIAYVSVLGEGPIARAWYDGAPSPGVPVQDALDYFAEKGYVVVRTTDALRQTNKPDDSAFAIVLQRIR